eukprot:gnl/TRDRNA2_/TRDRNA2_38776_c0_seq1.p1 gnl/TRDRNA2_/TRDRNA2_38776_c0~~gnl/TRDRNA2_/TRDRNA2_38776_c0_seq1.p1  ORF type:complete len:332 (+),score=10.48 gnl/TRDRNA2_/TRDRNA2_38776_c0_seq1:38-1033(+)
MQHSFYVVLALLVVGGHSVQLKNLESPPSASVCHEEKEPSLRSYNRVVDHNRTAHSTNLRNNSFSKKYPNGRVSLCDDELSKAFELAGTPIKGCYHGEQPLNNCLTTYPSQLPRLWQKYFRRHHKLPWTQERCLELLHASRRGEDISPTNYPHAVPDFLEALSFANMSTEGDVLVAGSVSPWLEAVLAAKGYKHVFTMDYGPRSSNTTITTIVQRQELEKASGIYDAIVSFSSIEHDGLGRYCDPINPDGDKAALQEFYHWLKPNGFLYLGLPVGPKSFIQNNGHRTYDKHRLAEITQDFEMLHMVDTHYNWGKKPKDAWQNQPWFLLRRK